MSHTYTSARKENKKKKETSFTRCLLIWKGKVGGAIVGMLVSKYKITHTQNHAMRPKWGLVYMPLIFHWEKQAWNCVVFLFFMMTMNSNFDVEFWDSVTRSICWRIVHIVKMIRIKRRNDLGKHSFIFLLIFILSQFSMCFNKFIYFEPFPWLSDHTLKRHYRSTGVLIKIDIFYNLKSFLQRKSSTIYWVRARACLFFAKEKRAIFLCFNKLEICVGSDQMWE